MGQMGTNPWFYSAISINLQISFVKGSSLNVTVLSLLCSVLGLGETVSWQGTMKREVFTDLYRWLRGSELALRHFLMWFGFRLNFRCVIKTIIRTSDNVSVWSWRAPLTELVRYHCQILNPVTRASRSNDSSPKKTHRRHKRALQLWNLCFCAPSTFWLTFHAYL